MGGGVKKSGRELWRVEVLVMAYGSACLLVLCVGGVPYAGVGFLA